MSAESAKLAAAKALWQQARWSQAEAALAQLPPAQMRGEALLLKTRLLLLRDPAAAVAVAGTLVDSRRAGRFETEAQILLGNALTQIGDFAEAQRRFDQAQAGAGSDRDLLAKVAMYRAVCLMLQGDIDAIEPLVATIRDTGDPDIRAQGASMHAVVLRAHEHYRAQIPVLIEALVELRAAPSPNLWVSASLLHMLAELVVDFWEPTLATLVEERFEAIDWHPEIGTWHFFIARALSWWYALGGDSLRAFRYLKRAMRFEVRDALRALNHADRAYLARSLGERLWAEQELHSADELCRNIAWEMEQDARDDASMALASLAELYAREDPVRADEYLARFSLFHQRLSASNTRRHDRIDRAFVLGTKGIVNAAQGKLGEAVQSLRGAFEIYDQIGFDWRAGKIAIELVSVTGDPAYLGIAAKKLAAYGRSWLALAYREAAGRLGVGDAVPGVKLTPAQWRVYHLLADGFSLTEVAAHLGRSLNTVRNHAGAVYAAFGVHSQRELRASASWRPTPPGQDRSDGGEELA